RGAGNWPALGNARHETPGSGESPRAELRLTPEQVRVVGEAAGLLSDRVVELPPYHCGALFRLPGYGKNAVYAQPDKLHQLVCAPPGEKELDSIDKQEKSYYFLV
ncbi:MAG: hypothetical protein ACP5MM_07040, partial [Acidithiobacillus sp.]